MVSCALSALLLVSNGFCIRLRAYTYACMEYTNVVITTCLDYAFTAHMLLEHRDFDSHSEGVAILSNVTSLANQLFSMGCGMEERRHSRSSGFSLIV